MLSDLYFLTILGFILFVIGFGFCLFLLKKRILQEIQNKINQSHLNSQKYF